MKSIKQLLTLNRSADLLIGSVPNLMCIEPIWRSALRRVQGFTARTSVRRILTLTALAAWLPLQLHAQGTAFTYQGRLNANGATTTGIYDLRFTIYDAAGGGGPVGGARTNSATGITNGLFTVTLDFGTGIFTGANRWLEIAVRTNGGGAFTPLAPRQAVTPTPYAITAGNLSGALPNAGLSGTYANAVTLNNGANSFSGNGTGLTNVNAMSLGGFSAASFWKLGGNAGTTAGTQFLGTTDNQPLEFKVNNQRGLRLEPTSFTDTVNVIGGSARNFVGAGVVGATIGGGGSGNYFGTAYTNRVEGNFGTVSGGNQNSIQTGADYATIGGGVQNTIQSFVNYATIGGGDANTIESSASGATLGGGTYNTIQNNAGGATLGGGVQNTIQPDATGATLGGGYQNTIQTNALYATLGGGHQNTIQTYAQYAAIGGGYQNAIQTYAQYATIGGGYQNTIDYYGIKATIGGGSGNFIQGYGLNSTIAGGYANSIGFDAEGSAIGGGHENWIADWAGDATISGGKGNTVGGYGGTVSGGISNYAGGLTAFAAGYRAKANHDGTFVWADFTEADFASTAANQFAIRASGGVVLSDSTPNLSFGNTTRQMLNLYGTDYAIGAQYDSLYFRCANFDGNSGFSWYKGGVHNDGYAQPGTGGIELMHLTAGGLWVNTTFVSSSDRNVKQDFAAVNSRAVLEKVAQLPIQTWAYKSDPHTKHLGPVAQDFYAAFAVGPDDKHITTVDESGVALAAIQGLNEKVESGKQKAETKMEALAAENAELRARLVKLEQFKNAINGGAK